MMTMIKPGFIVIAILVVPLLLFASCGNNGDKEEQKTIEPTPMPTPTSIATQEPVTITI